MTNQVIKYDAENEEVRLALSKFLDKHGVMQTFVAKRCNLSNCSISLFLNSKRILVDDKLEIIKDLINF